MSVCGPIVEALATSRFRYASEDELQAALATALAGAGLDVVREVRLDGRCRIDLMVGRVGVEVKVDGKADAVLRQVRRYLALPMLDGLVLVTNRVRHRLPAEIDGKPLAVVCLSGGGLCWDGGR